MIECVLCSAKSEYEIWRDDLCRVILIDEQGYPGFCRVILNSHIAEMTDLPPDQRSHVMNIVWAVEQAQRDILRPDKINLASFGNYVPHVHWHVIPRYNDDPHFPEAFWGEKKRQGAERVLDLNALTEAIAANCSKVKNN